jgi:hypothetical protein
MDMDDMDSSGGAEPLSEEERRMAEALRRKLMGARRGRIPLSFGPHSMEPLTRPEVEFRKAKRKRLPKFQQSAEPSIRTPKKRGAIPIPEDCPRCFEPLERYGFFVYASYPPADLYQLTCPHCFLEEGVGPCWFYSLEGELQLQELHPPGYPKGSIIGKTLHRILRQAELPPRLER